MEHPWEDRIENRKSDEDEWTVDPSSQSALPFDEAAAVPASAPAPSAVKRCESCGAPSDAAGAGAANLCTACERAFHGVLDNSAEPQAPESDDHAAQLDALFKALESAPPVEAPAPAAVPPIDADIAAPAPSSPFGSPSAFAFASPSPATGPASPFVDASGGAIATPGLTASLSRVPFANITPAAEPRSALFASHVVNAGAPAVNDDPDAAPEYRSVLLPKAEPEAAAPAASTPLPNPVKPDVDFSTVMLPRLSPAQLEAAGILPTVHLEPQAAVEPSSVMAADRVASFVDAGAVIEQAEVVDAATVIADQVAIVQPSPVDATNEPAAPAAVPQAAAVVVVPPVPQEAPAPAAKPKQAAPAKPAAAAKPKSGALRSLATAAAVVLIVGAIGIPLSRLWLGRSQEIVTVAAEPAKRPSPAPAAQEKAPPLQAVAAPAVVPAPAPAPSAPAAAPTPVAAATRKPAVQVPAAPVNAEAPTPQLAAIAPTFVGAAPSVAALPAPEAVAPAPVAAAPAESPIGPFYETRAVDQVPQVTVRVEPQLPAGLQEQSLNEIVIVRVLVSQSGRPALTSVLRRSKSGPELDEAVLAAVRQWSFTPATKHGAAVSCFLHVGVPVGR